MKRLRNCLESIVWGPTDSAQTKKQMELEILYNKYLQPLSQTMGADVTSLVLEYGNPGLAALMKFLKDQYWPQELKLPNLTEVISVVDAWMTQPSGVPLGFDASCPGASNYIPSVDTLSMRLGVHPNVIACLAINNPRINEGKNYHDWQFPVGIVLPGQRCQKNYARLAPNDVDKEGWTLKVSNEVRFNKKDKIYLVHDPEGSTVAKVCVQDYDHSPYDYSPSKVTFFGKPSTEEQRLIWHRILNILELTMMGKIMWIPSDVMPEAVATASGYRLAGNYWIRPLY